MRALHPRLTKTLKLQDLERKLRRMLRGIFRTKNLDDILAQTK